MQHQTLIPYPERAVAVRLLADAEASLDGDLRRARLCLRQLATLINEPGAGVGAETGTQAMVRGGLAPWQARRVTAHVDANPGSTITVSDLAGVTRLSNGHFCRAFKAMTGRTPHAFIVQRRIEHAKTLMLTTSETLSQVAAMCGMTDQAHLTRLFRRHLGTTPLAWRQTG